MSPFFALRLSLPAQPISPARDERANPKFNPPRDPLRPNPANPAFPDDAKPDLTTLSLEQLLDVRVEAAALHPQTLEDAPASVTVLTAQDLRKYGYRTLGEALASVRGFYGSYDRSYHSVGVRGFNLPGDYASRFLIMVNGHNMADHIFDSMLWFGVDFPIEMNLIKQIEIIRGPSSALYGSNGIFATINIVTKSPEEAGPPALTLDGGSFGEKKAQVMIAEPLGKHASFLFSGSVFNNAGESPLYFPQFNTPANNHGQALNMDSEKGYHFFANLVWRNWSITAVLSDRNKIQPISWGPTIFNDRGTQLMESAGYVEAAYARELARGTLEWRTYFNADHLRGRFDYPLDTPTGSVVEDNRTFSESDWIGTRLSYRFDASRLGALTAGLEGTLDLRAYQGSADVEPVPMVFVNIDKRDKTLAFFMQDEKKLSPHWSLDLGARYDLSMYRKNFVSPACRLDLPALRRVVLQVPLRPQLPQPQQLPVVLWRWLLRRSQSRVAPGKREYRRNRRGAKTGKAHESGSRGI